ncbi:MAG: hypothetical protein M3203_04375 [Actinomycetota bacterium]|nr:hypothetical protein [Actinomycetota bacterium]
MRIRNLAVAPVALLVAALPLLAPGAGAEGVVAEAEAGTGAGQIMMRSGASGQRTVWLHASEARQLPFTARWMARTS